MAIGANPVVSNGSLMTAPGMPKRLRALRARGGKLVVVDPRRTETARIADEHLSIRPGTDALFLFALVHVLFEEGLVRLGRLETMVQGRRRSCVRSPAVLHPRSWRTRVGIDAPTLRRIARELAAAPSAACYGRIGTCTQEFGTLASWLIDVVNVLTGNLDRPGGAMFSAPAASFKYGETSRQGRRLPYGRWKSRVRGLPEFGGELPAVALAEEIETPGEGQIRGLVTTGGKSGAVDARRRAIGPRARRARVHGRDRHLRQRDDASRESHPADDLASRARELRPAALQHGDPQRREILPGDRRGGSGREAGLGDSPGARRAAHGHARRQTSRRSTTRCSRKMVEQAVGRAGTPAGGVAREAALALLGWYARPADRVLDLLLRAGTYGDGFDERQDGLSLEEACEMRRMESISGRSSLDSRQLSPRRAARSSSSTSSSPPTSSGLRRSLERPADGLLLIGRRQLRSNNSWMHNAPTLVKGPERCTLLVHPQRCGATGRRRRCSRAHRESSRRRRGSRDGERRGHARRRQPAARLGPRPRGRRSARGRLPSRSAFELPRRSASRRCALRQCGFERHPGQRRRDLAVSSRW